MPHDVSFGGTLPWYFSSSRANDFKSDAMKRIHIMLGGIGIQDNDSVAPCNSANVASYI